MSETEVVHPRFGRGVVRDSRHAGFELRVEFDDGLTRWVRRDSLIEEPQQPESVPSRADDGAAFDDDRFKHRRMIEAFRLGIVPYDCADEFTFGRDEEVRTVSDWLAEPDESTLVLLGEYGTGKTHLLQYLYGHALKQGFAVAHVEMDPNESPFCKPKLVYSHLVRSLQFYSQRNARRKGFRGFVSEAIRRDLLGSHDYFTHMYGNIEDETLWEWIEGRHSGARPWHPTTAQYSNLPGLYDFTTAANIFCNLLSGLGWAAVNGMGLKGLLLLFDEAETIEQHYYQYQLNKSYNFLRALIRTANNEAELRSAPERVDLDLDSCRMGDGPRIPFLFSECSGLKLVFAFTSLDWNRAYYDWHEGVTRLRIPELENAPQVSLQHLYE